MPAEFSPDTAVEVEASVLVWTGSDLTAVGRGSAGVASLLGLAAGTSVGLARTVSSVLNGVVGAGEAIGAGEAVGAGAGSELLALGCAAGTVGADSVRAVPFPIMMFWPIGAS